MSIAQHLASFVRALPYGAMAVDANGVVVAANAEAGEILNNASVGRHITASIRLPPVLQAIGEARRTGAVARIRQAFRGDVERSIDFGVSMIGEPSVLDGLVLVTMRDLTREEQIERMRADFVANASHELRTPLASLAGFIETLQGPARNDEKARAEFLHLMKTQADRMARLIDDLLSLSRIEISEHLPPNDATDLALAARQAAELLAETARKANCEMVLDIPARLPVVGDFGQLSQVLINLVENAIKYAGQDNKVEITGEARDGYGYIEVKDHGPGIAERHVPRLTERFYRVDVQDSRTRGGTGLGLAIAKHIVNRHRGKLLIESAIGRGSTFTVCIPLQKQ